MRDQIKKLCVITAVIYFQNYHRIVSCRERERERETERERERERARLKLETS